MIARASSLDPTHNSGPQAGTNRFVRLEAEYLRPHRRAIGVALGALVLQSLFVLPLPWLQGVVIDRLGNTSDATWLIAAAAAIPLVCLVGRMLLGWFSSSLMSRVSLEFVRALTDGLHQKLQRLPLAYFDRQETGQLMARLTSDVGTLLIFLSGSSLQLVADLVLAVGIVGVLAWISWPLAIVSVAAAPLLLLSHRQHSGRIGALARSVQQQNAAVYALLSERISGIRTVRACGAEQRELLALEEQLAEQTSRGRQSLNAISLQGLSAMLIGSVAGGLVVCLAAALVQRQWITLGEAVAFIAYLALLYQPLVRLAQFYGGISATLAAVERISEVLEEPEPPLARQRGAGRVRGEIQLRKVSFRYRVEGPDVLERIHLRIEPGMTVGIMGDSGAGKSTLLALLPRLYDLPAGGGRILLDGDDIRGLRVSELRKNVVLVPQQARLFEGTLRFNLTYAQRDADERLMWRTLDAVALADLVESLPQGLDTWVGERGASLSGGQRQRLALARALIARPPVLLLDDCTSALDAETEARVRERIASLRPGQTRVIVSHKPQSFLSADWLVVLAQGRIVRQGRPHRILADSMAILEVGNLPHAGQTVVKAGAF